MKSFLIKFTLVIVCLFISLNASSVLAAVSTLTDTTNIEDPTKSTFKIVVCDGPDLSGVATSSPAKAALYKSAGKTEATYIPCNFNGMMIQVQHLINIMMVLGVFAAIILFTYAGYLLMTGKEGDRKKAKDIFPKILTGFIIMLVAWVVVYEILNWLTVSSLGFGKLLGQ